MKASIVNLNPIRVKTVNPLGNEPPKKVETSLKKIDRFYNDKTYNEWQQAESNRKEYIIEEEWENANRFYENNGGVNTAPFILGYKEGFTKSKTLYPFSLEDLKNLVIYIQDNLRETKNGTWIYSNGKAPQNTEIVDDYVRSIHPPHKIGDIVNIEIISEESLTAKIIEPYSVPEERLGNHDDESDVEYSHKHDQSREKKIADFTNSKDEPKD